MKRNLKVSSFATIYDNPEIVMASYLYGSVEAPRFATAVGLALYAASRVALGSDTPSGRRLQLNAPNVDKLAQKVKTWLQDFF